MLNYESRTAGINQFRAVLHQKVGVQDAKKVKPMNKNQFIAFLRYKEGHPGIEKKEEQEKQWKEVRSLAASKFNGDFPTLFADVVQHRAHSYPLHSSPDDSRQRFP